MHMCIYAYMYTYYKLYVCIHKSFSHLTWKINCVTSPRMSISDESHSKKAVGHPKKYSFLFHLKSAFFVTFFHPKKSETIKYERIQVIASTCNAWEVPESVPLWPAIVKTLGTTIEKYFGRFKVRICRSMLRFETSSDSDVELARSNSFKPCPLCQCKLFVIVAVVVNIILLSAFICAMFYGPVAKGISGFFGIFFLGVLKYGKWK